ncbi:beta-lactamase family protein [Luteimonas sp. Y-2-2-4F]|nr:serine hydrolase domain-containing protein [Luteimonas sp. Y-2-2-4F]MCD9030392.1 beta-lactamase family protein [Luteimonas sp. Y-2-2-4F]
MRAGIVFWMACAVLAWPAQPAAAAPPQGPPALLARWDRDEHPDLRGVVVLHRGRRVAERYYNGAEADELHDVRSAGKSVTALLVGIAIDRGAIGSVDDPVARYWAAAADRPIGQVPLRDVLTMRSGLDAFDEDPDSPGHEDRMDAAADPQAFVLGLPRVDPPGARYRYNSATAYVAGVVVANAARETMGAFAGRELFAPLGIADWRWDADASGMTKGQGNLRLTTRGLAAIGEMVRNGGRANGRRVVGEAWIAQMLAPRVDIAAVDPSAEGYGYFWYRKEHRIGGAAVPVSFASGNGGNKIYVAPACDLVVAITSSAYGRGHGQRRSEAILLAVLTAQVESGGCRSGDAPDAPDAARDAGARSRAGALGTKRTLATSRSAAERNRR